MEWEKTFANDVFDKGLISTIHQELNSKKKSDLKMGKTLKFSQRHKWPTF